VLCVGEEEPDFTRAIRRQPLLPMRPGQAERRAPDYLGHGTTNLFAALDFKTGTAIGQFHCRRRRWSSAKFLGDD